jgi:hypothetical protein
MEPQGWRHWLLLPAIAGLAMLWPAAAFGYSVQTHEQLVDLAWKPAIVPLLLARYPGLTQAQLEEAHAFAYGGCAIQDLGYYPFGNQFFSNLTHYVRSGDFIRSLLRNAKTPDELAFAVGALTHYFGDTRGHSMAVNPSVAEEFPQLAAKYGPSVFYDENPHAHVRVEFAFDINEIAKRRFAPSAYLSHVGLKVATGLLARAFFETYGIPQADVLGKKRQRPTLGGYEFSVRRFLPRIAYAETVLHRRRMPDDVNDADFQALQGALKQADFENGWDQYRRKAGIGTYMLAGLIYVLPPIGPLALLRIKGPERATEQKYVKSVNASIAAIRRVLTDVAAGDPSKTAGDLPNRDLDTGLKTAPGAYRLTDQTYADLLRRLTQPGGPRIPAGLKADVLEFYADPAARNTTKKDAKRWAEVQSELGVLKQLPTWTEP